MAYAYAEEGYGFGVEPGSATPDDIWDFVYAHKDRYVMVHPLELFGGYEN